MDSCIANSLVALNEAIEYLNQLVPGYVSQGDKTYFLSTVEINTDMFLEGHEIPWNEFVTLGLVMTSPLINVAYNTEKTTLRPTLAAINEAIVGKGYYNEYGPLIAEITTLLEEITTNDYFSLEFASRTLRKMAKHSPYLLNQPDPAEMDKIKTMLQLARIVEPLLRTQTNGPDIRYLAQTYENVPALWFYVSAQVAMDLFPFSQDYSFVDVWGILFFQLLVLPTNTMSAKNKLSHPCMISSIELTTQTIPDTVFEALRSKCGVALSITGWQLHSAKDLDGRLIKAVDTFRQSNNSKRNSGMVIAIHTHFLEALYTIGLGTRHNQLIGLHMQYVIDNQFFNRPDNNRYFLVDLTACNTAALPRIVAQLTESAEGWDEFVGRCNAVIAETGMVSAPEYQNLPVSVAGKVVIDNITVIIVSHDHYTQLICGVLASNQDSFALSHANMVKKGAMYDEKPKCGNLCTEIIVSTENGSTSVCSIASVNLAPFTPVGYDFSAEGRQEAFKNGLLSTVGKVSQLAHLMLRTHNMQINSANEELCRRTIEDMAIGVGSFGEHLFYGTLCMAGITENATLANELLESIWRLLMERPPIEAVQSAVDNWSQERHGVPYTGVISKGTYTTAVMPGARAKSITRNTGQVSGTIFCLDHFLHLETRSTGTYMTLPALTAMIAMKAANKAEYMQHYAAASSTVQSKITIHLPRLCDAPLVSQIKAFAWRNQFVDQSISIMLYQPALVDPIKAMYMQLKLGHDNGLVSIHYYHETRNTSVNATNDLLCKLEPISTVL